MRTFTPPSFVHQRQKGVVLIMALVAMGVIAVTSALAIRNVTLNDRIGNNIRVQQLTMHAAEVALRWCEADVLRGPAAVGGSANVPVDPTEAALGAPGGSNENWRDLARWNTNAAVTVPGALLTVSVGGLQVMPFNELPQCMAQSVATVDSGPLPLSYVVQITARAFSPNYDRTSGGTAGGEVWLQSILKDYNSRPQL